MQDESFQGIYKLKLTLGLAYQDDRIEGGYEAVPTRDIHMKQVGLKDQWDYILEEYVGPLQQRVFTGYVSVRHSLLDGFGDGVFALYITVATVYILFHFCI